MSKLAVRHATLADLDSIGHLIEQYPFKIAQRKVQQLDHGRLNRFFLEGIRRSPQFESTCRLLERDGEIVAFASLSSDAWHSSIYGFSMGKIGSWLCFDSDEGKQLIGAVLTEAREQSHQHLSVRIDCEDFKNLHLFEGAGFYLVDASTKFSRPMPMTDGVPAGETGGWSIRVATAADAEWLCELGGKAHEQTHFMKDPNLDPEKTRKLFGAWVRRCAESLAYRIYILCDTAGVRRGFVIYLRNKSFAEAVGRNPLILDYVILDPDIRGSGRGPWFIAQTLMSESDSGFDYCELRTSLYNHAAIGCYEKLGFRMCAGDFVLHKLLRNASQS